MRLQSRYDVQTGLLFSLLSPGIDLSHCIDVSKTNYRAELLAAIAAMRVHEGNLEIRSDSEYVVHAAPEPVQGERQRTAEGNVVVCAMFACELRLKTTRRIHFVWVKGTCDISTGESPRRT